MSSLFEDLQKRYEGKKVLVVGLGLQGGGSGVVSFFAKLGAHVTVTDKKSDKELLLTIKKLENLSVTYRLGEHIREDFLSADVIFKGPSVPWDMPELQEALQKGVPVEMEASFFASRCPCRIIGVTGTRGKSTTSTMIYELLKENGIRSFLAGNVPNLSTIGLLETITPNDTVVLELSSQQLSGFHKKRLSPHIAVFTNLYPDHLNFYKNMDDYFYDKKALYLYQKQEDYLIVNKKLQTEIQKDSPLSTVVSFSSDDFPYAFAYLKGIHNLENAAAALAVSKILNLPEDKSINILKRFKGLPYREEFVGEKQNITFINDTTATTPVAAIKAIESYKEDLIVLLLGGKSKNLPVDELLTSLQKVTKIVLLPGSFTTEIEPDLKAQFAGKLIPVIPDFQEAIKRAYDEALLLKKQHPQKKVVILLSPAATSFDQFQNEFHRGDEFNRIVASLI